MFKEENDDVYIGSIPISKLSKNETIETILEAAFLGKVLRVHLCNAFTIVSADKDPELKQILQESDLNIPDSKGIYWALRKNGLSDNFRGKDLLDSILATTGDSKLTHYMFGGKIGDEPKVIKSLQSAHHSIIYQVAPYISDINRFDLGPLIKDIDASGANLIWVGLGTPKQDKLVALLAKHVQVPIIPIGAVFDFIAGRQKEAPLIMRKMSLEWLFRFALEPRRLWKRYLIGNLAYLRIVFRG